MHITGKTRIVGVIGHPIDHSLSPPMHNGEFERLGLDYVYTCWDVDPAQVEPAMKGLKALGVLGYNVTIPHKQAVMPLLDSISDEAELVGAVNTVHHAPDGTTRGYNTDVTGWIDDIEQDISLKGKAVCMIGAGGAARAVSTGACLSGASRLTFWDMREDAAQVVAERLKARFPNTEIVVLKADAAERRDAVAAADVLVNTTPIGMHSAPGIPIPADWLKKSLYLYDVIYAPARTELAQAAAAAGCQTRNGLGMLARQGARAFEIWTGTRPDASRMEAILKTILKV